MLKAGWIAVFRISKQASFKTELLEKDRLLVVLPENHPFASCDKFPVEALADFPFMLLEKGGKADISEILDKYNVKPCIHVTTVDDYAVMSMVEKGLGISILPELILRRIPYRIVAKELDIPAYRNLGIAVKDGKPLSLAVRRFMEYLHYRNESDSIK